MSNAVSEERESVVPLPTNTDVKRPHSPALMCSAFIIPRMGRARRYACTWDISESDLVCLKKRSLSMTIAAQVCLGALTYHHCSISSFRSVGARRV